jgi:hypothetical protein
MKLAEALVLRKDAQRRLEQVQQRMRQSALVQEGEQPPEDPQELLREMDELLAQLVSLIIQINHTNIQTRLADGSALTDALARRDVWDQEIELLQSLADRAAERTDRYGRSEIRKISTVDVAALRRRVNDVSRQRRELDTAIQALNWATDLIEA